MGMLNVSDKIYRVNYGKITTVYTVERVTKTLAICQSGTKFKREFRPNICPAWETDSWSSASYELENEGLKEQLFRVRAIDRIRVSDYKGVKTEALKGILKLIDNQEAEANKICKITNGQFSWTLEVDGNTINFNGGGNADYFADLYTRLGYEIVWVKEQCPCCGGTGANPDLFNEIGACITCLGSGYLS